MSKIPILMYHDVSLHRSEGLTIGISDLEAQLQYLDKQNYTSYHCKELMHLTKLDSKNNIVITFDDGFISQLELAVPLLKKYNFKATFFIPLKYLGQNDKWHTNSKNIMTAEMLNTLDPDVIELAYHSYAHDKYHELTKIEIEADISKSFDVVFSNKLQMTNSLAYPYGKYPKGKTKKKIFIEQLLTHQFQYGFRIGNRINKFPFKNPFEIQRIDVKGEFSLNKFKRHLKWGKLF
tara:strand:+ start:35 stop:739 length:705 start_codon:yes stop_codon:yes gene_type:complete